MVKLFICLFSVGLSLKAYGIPSINNFNDILNEEIVFSGPNCHNTSLRSLGLVASKRYIHEPEMVQILNDNCNLIEDVSLQAIGVIHLGPESKPMHSFVSLQQNLVFTKNGVNKKEKVEIQTFDKMKEIHFKALKSYCGTYKIKPCDLQIKYYQCEPVEVFLPKVERFLDLIGRDRHEFFKIRNQKKLTKLVEQINWQKNCEAKKKTLQSMVLTVNLANMSSLGRVERFQTEDLELKMRNAFEQAPCD